MKNCIYLSLLLLLLVSNVKAQLFNNANIIDTTNQIYASHTVDIDGDGDVDILSSTYTDFIIFKNDGFGNFTDHIEIIDSIGEIKNIESSDIDNDGDIDVLLSLNKDIVWLENLGEGKLDHSLNYIISLEYVAQTIEPIDIDNDGDIDILISDGFCSGSYFIDLCNPSFTGCPYDLIWLENLGGGQFNSEEKFIVSSGGFGSDNIAMATLDIENDNYPDIIILPGGFYSGDTSYYELLSLYNNSFGEFSKNETIIDTDTSEFSDNIVTGDINNDGFEDFITLSTTLNNSGISIFENDGNGAFKNKRIIDSSSLYFYHSLFLEDLDQDGLLDILVFSIGQNNLSFYRNMGNSNFAAPEIILSNMNSSYYSCAWPRIPNVDNEGYNHLEDFDNDGDLDVLTMTRGWKLTWFENLKNRPSVSGQVFFDNDLDGNKDNDERGIGFSKISISPDEIISYSTELGYFTFVLDPKEYSFSASVDSNWTLTSSPEAYNITITDSSYSDTFLFGFAPKYKINDLDVFVTANARARCGTNVPFSINYTNSGTTILNGYITVTNEYLIERIDTSISTPTDSVFGDQIFWKFEDLYPGENGQINLFYTIADQNFVGDTLILEAKAIISKLDDESSTYPNSNSNAADKTKICHCTGSANTPYKVMDVAQSFIDGYGDNDHNFHDCDIIPITDRNSDGKIDVDDCLIEQPAYENITFTGIYESIVRCSYDPNDKQVNPTGEGETHLTLKDQSIVYTIRFQNNGNDTAYHIQITDSLDGNLDVNTFKFLGASHKPIDIERQTYNQGQNNEYNELRFIFDNIRLVDSTTNYSASQGFIMFSISPIKGVEENTVIKNHAEIVFDKFIDFPIITNVVENTLVSRLLDSQKPNAICKTLHTVYVNELGSASLVAGDIDNNSTDNVGVDNREIDKTSFNCQQLGNNIVELTVYDAVGNSDKCIATISVKDTIRPSIICLDTVINLAAGATLNLGADDLIEEASDNCGVTNKTISKNTFTDVDAGSNTVVLEAVDASINKATCTSKVEISVVSNLLESLYGITTTLSPNPSSSYVVLSLSKPLPFNYDIRITDLSGKLVGEYLNQSGINKTIDIRSLSKGMYLLNLREQGQSETLSTFKMMVE